jgi:hypothetical protein
VQVEWIAGSNLVITRGADQLNHMNHRRKFALWRKHIPGDLSRAESGQHARQALKQTAENGAGGATTLRIRE